MSAKAEFSRNQVVHILRVNFCKRIIKVGLMICIHVNGKLYFIFQSNYQYNLTFYLVSATHEDMYTLKIILNLTFMGNSLILIFCKQLFAWFLNIYTPKTNTHNIHLWGPIKKNKSKSRFNIIAKIGVIFN